MGKDVVGKGVTDFVIGDCIVSDDNHAEYVCVPIKMVARMSENISNEEVAFIIIGSRGLQGIRELNP